MNGDAVGGDARSGDVTSGDVTSGVELVVVAPDGATLEVLTLPHGADPEARLAAAGWYLVALLDAVRTDEVVQIRVQAERGQAVAALPEPAEQPSSGAGADGERPVPYQRVACYGVVIGDRRLLLTELSERVSGAAGSWNLPGGGLDPGEQPHDGLVREIWEETGHDVVRARLADVETRHWVGRSPGGRLEDFHAVRLIYRAQVAQVREPVVHDVGGSTARARWVSREEIPDYPIVPTVQRALTRIGWDRATGPTAVRP
ncbi:hypothetical protein GCM10027055_18010 [Janibacter alkaliphilus]|nr:NUDIX domain-containing protein [Janibacter alkaliphilus]